MQVEGPQESHERPFYNQTMPFPSTSYQSGCLLFQNRRDRFLYVYFIVTPSQLYIRHIRPCKTAKALLNVTWSLPFQCSISHTWTLTIITLMSYSCSTLYFHLYNYNRAHGILITIGSLTVKHDNLSGPRVDSCWSDGNHGIGTIYMALQCPCWLIFERLVIMTFNEWGESDCSRAIDASMMQVLVGRKWL
jgi:hypothetical protein